MRRLRPFLRMPSAAFLLSSGRCVSDPLETEGIPRRAHCLRKVFGSQEGANGGGKHDFQGLAFSCPNLPLQEHLHGEGE